MKTRGVTLIELLIVTAILALLSGVLLYPTTQTMREQRLADERFEQEAGLAMAMPMLVADVRAARQVSPAEGGWSIRRADGAEVAYRVDGRGWLRRASGGADQALVPNVTTFSIERAGAGARVRIAGGTQFATMPAAYDRALTVSTFARFQEVAP